MNANDLPLPLRIASGWYRPMSTRLELAETLRADPRLKHFASLNHAGQREAIRRMHLDGNSVYGIATATGLSVEAVALILQDKP